MLQGSPEEVLQAVAQGCDIFDSSYPIQATTNGYALSFPQSPEQEEAACGGADSELGASSGAGGAGAAATGCDGADDSKLNLWALDYR